MKDELGERIKGYEDCFRHTIPRKSCIILRLDGKAFHTLTRGMKRPFDEDLRECMFQATLALCENIQNVKLAYTQSDEISLLLTDYENIKTDAWFDNNIQKMVSISASICTHAFNKEFNQRFSTKKVAYFDSRVFLLPKEEVCNYFIWRQKDCTRNSINMVAQSYFSHKECHKKNTSQLQDMLMLQKNVNWNDYPIQYKRGVSFYKEIISKSVEALMIKGVKLPETVKRRVWKIDYEMPILTQDREYVDKWVFPQGEKV